MAQLGHLLAEADGRRLTAGLTVPARGFAAALAAAAAVVCRDVIHPLAPDDLEEHLATLRTTPPRTPIKYHAKDKIHDGLWLGIESVAGSEMLSFETRRMNRKLPLRCALHIRLTGEVASDTQLQAKRVQVPPILRNVLGDSAALTYLTTTRPDCLIVGTQHSLEEELMAETFYAANEGDSSGGGLQELVRARELPGARRYYRTVIVPSTSGPAPDLREANPHVVVFDGGRPYLRWRHLWPGARHLVLIDRSVTSAEEAASELSMAYIERAGDEPLFDSLEIPPGVEAIAFERAA